MARHVFRFSHLIRWQYLRWGLAIPALPLALLACNSHPLKEPIPNPQQETDVQVVVSPMREVDILFLVDNSPSMDPKQRALATNFPAMMNILQNLPDGLPDVHIGVVDSDMGAGSGELQGNCARVLGDKGILWGNDSAAGAIATVASISSGCGLNSGARFIKDVRNANGVGRDKNYTGNLTDVFSCLAKAVGVGGCGEEHQLQATRVALVPQKDINDVQNKDFLRPEAYLAVVLITDEEDCSAVPNSDTSQKPNNDGIFAHKMPGDTASMRCAARGHVCNGAAIPNYDTSNGYTATTGFSTDFANCAAKEYKGNQQQDPGSRDYNWLPLISVQDMVDTVTSVKGKPQEQILVSGVIGWPQGGSLTGVKYQIDKDSTSLKPQDTLWDYMPICSLPTVKSDDGNIYKAYGGLRLKKFIDSFGSNGAVFSICSNDFTPAMTQIGTAIAKKLKPGCLNYKLIDTRTDLADVQPECQVMDEQSCSPPGQGDCLPTGFKEASMPECLDPNSGNPLNPNNPNADNVVPNDGDHRPCWYLVYDSDATTGCPDVPHQKITALRMRGEAAPAGTMLAMKCLTCARADQKCPALGEQ